MRNLLVSLFAPLLAITVVIAAPADDAAERAAVRSFLTELRPESRAKALFAFDDPHRLDWHYIPRERVGLPLSAMNDAERRATHALLRRLLTPSGYGRANGVIELEGVLREIENNPSRDPGAYFVSFFGNSSNTATDAEPWTFRFEGHHLALNFSGTKEGGVQPTPLFLGANPAEVLTGPHAGFKLLAPHEELARALVKSLTPEQRKKAVIAETAPADVLFGPGKAADPDMKEGLLLTSLTPAQLEIERELLRAVGSDVAMDAPSDPPTTTRFVWAGGMEPGQGHYWRLAGPDDVLEYDDTQNDANHVHFLWRDRKNDFAADWLARHHAAEAGAR